MKSRLVLVTALLVGLACVVAGPQAPAPAQRSSASGTPRASNPQHVAVDRSRLGVEAQSNVSAALGRDIRSYRTFARAGGFRATNPRQELVADFTSEGVAVRSGSSLWKLALRGYGYGNALRPVSMAHPKANLNRVEYQRGTLTEWYVNGPAGLEQGFTLSEPPGHAGGQPLTIAMAQSGDLGGSVDAGRTGLTLTARNAPTQLRYSGLAAFDASKRPLRAWLEVRDEQLLLKVADEGARYPVVVDPWVRLAKLTGSDNINWDQLGYSVAISGNTVAVGSPGKANPNEKTGDDAGTVYVFVMPTSGWTDMTQTAKLVASDGKVDDDLGYSVAIDGNTIVSGAPHAIQGQALGAAYVFVMPPGGWVNMTETAKLTPSDGVLRDFFGVSVSISGNTVVVGSPSSSPFTFPGAAYVFAMPLSGWAGMNETAKLTASDGATGLGADVSISGNTVVAGATGHPGATYVFVEPPSGWENMIQTARLSASDAKTPVTSVAISGNTVVAGAGVATVAGHSRQGKAYVFVRPPTGWANMTQTAILSASDGATADRLGFSASISGNTVLISTPYAYIGGNKAQGAAYAFAMPAGGWTNMTETAKITAPDGKAGDNIGFSVAISGNTVVAGAPNFALTSSPGHGSAYVFTGP
jgi:hypothetical protein